MWMMEMIYTRNGMAWGIKRAFSLQRFMGWKNCERIDRWAKNRRPSAAWENWNEKRLGLGSKSEITLPIGTYVGSRNVSNAFFRIDANGPASGFWLLGPTWNVAWAHKFLSKSTQPLRLSLLCFMLRTNHPPLELTTNDYHCCSQQ
jgi:hypothetical protein